MGKPAEKTRALVCRRTVTVRFGAPRRSGAWRRVAVAIAALLVWLVAGCGRNRAAPQSQVVADVNGQPITKQQVYDSLETNDGGDAARRALDALIVRQLIRQDADKKGIKVTGQEIDARIASMKDYVLATYGEDLDAWLKDTGQTMDELQARISLQMLTAKLLFPDRDRKEYFASHQADLKDLPHNNESVIFRQIVVPTKEEADALRRQLEADKSLTFAKLAEEKSMDPMTRSRGGMAGWLAKGKIKPPDPELEKVLFSLKPGEVSQPLAVPPSAAAATPSGQKQPEQWRIIKVEKRVSPHQITLADNQDVIEEWMLQDRSFQMQIQQFFANLRAQAKVDIRDPRYKLLADMYEKSRQMPQEAGARERTRGGAARGAARMTMPPSMPAAPAGGPGTAPQRRPALRRAAGPAATRALRRPTGQAQGERGRR